MLVSLIHKLVQILMSSNRLVDLRLWKTCSTVHRVAGCHLKVDSVLLSSDPLTQLTLLMISHLPWSAAPRSSRHVATHHFQSARGGGGAGMLLEDTSPGMVGGAGMLLEDTPPGMVGGAGMLLEDTPISRQHACSNIIVCQSCQLCCQ